MSRATAARVAAGTVVAELAFTRHSDVVDPLVDAVVVTPLTDGEDVVVALPYARRDLADALADAAAVALVASDDRLTLPGWKPLAIVGRVDVEPDPEGTRFREVLLDDELRKHPPSRLLADSLRDRRDNWWFLPRLLCRVVDVTVEPVEPRSAPDDGVAAWLTPGGLQVATVEVTPHGDDRLVLRRPSGAVLGGAGDPACLLRHDYSIPDLERRTSLVERGRLEGDVLRVASRDGAVALPGPPGLLTRVRRHLAFARACRRELARQR